MAHTAAHTWHCQTVDIGGGILKPLFLGARSDHGPVGELVTGKHDGLRDHAAGQLHVGLAGAAAGYGARSLTQYVSKQGFLHNGGGDFRLCEYQRDCEGFVLLGSNVIVASYTQIKGYTGDMRGDFVSLAVQSRINRFDIYFAVQIFKINGIRLRDRSFQSEVAVILGNHPGQQGFFHCYSINGLTGMPHGNRNITFANFDTVLFHGIGESGIQLGQKAVHIQLIFEIQDLCFRFVLVTVDQCSEPDNAALKKRCCFR